MTGSIVNVLPFLNTWSSMLLSFAAWIQLSFLGDTDGRWQSQWPCHSLKQRDRSRVHSDSLALTSVYRCHTV